MNKLSLLALIFLCSCGSMKTIDSTTETNTNNTEVFPNLDLDLKIRYQISNDDKNLHVKLTSTDFTVISKILTTGLRVCFDEKGGKKDKLYLEYPRYQKQAFSDRIMARVRNTQRENFSLNNLINEVPNEAIFGDNGTIEPFPVIPADTSDIKVSVKLVNQSELSYDLLIPFSRISKKGILSLAHLSIGVVTQSPNIPNISGKLMDVSGQDAFGSGRVIKSQVDTYARQRPGVPTPSRINDFWFKVHLNGVK